MKFLFATLLFLVAVVGFSLLAKTFYKERVEEELRILAEEALSEAGMVRVRVDFDHHDASLSGYVDSEEDRSKIAAILVDAVPMARLEEGNAESLPIRPTLPPSLLITRAPASAEILMEGVLGGDGESVRSLITGRLESLESVAFVNDQTRIDPRQLPVEHVAELASIALELLRESEEARIQFDGGGLRLQGQVSNTGRRDSILELAGKVDGENLETAIEILEPAQPLFPSTLGITRNRFGIILTGRVASEESRETLLRILDNRPYLTRVTNRIEIDETLVPAWWERNAENLIDTLLDSFVGEMTAEFTAQLIRLAGTTESEESYGELVGFLEAMKKEGDIPEILLDVAVATVMDGEKGESEKPLELLLTFQPGLLVLTGALPDISFVGPLEVRLKEWKEDFSIENELVETPATTGDGWVEKLPEFIEEAAKRTESGVYRFGSEGLMMEGITRDLSDKQILQNVAINSVPSGYSIENLLSHEDESFPEPELLPENREKLSEELKKFPIYFAKNSDLISAEEREKIESVIQLLDEAGFPVGLTATGFADNVGNEEYNRQLSLRRAESVVQELIAGGVEKEQIAKESKGEDASSVSRADRWKSRRVEIRLTSADETDTATVETSEP